MNTKVKQSWLRALTSGRFKQGRGQLKTENGKYCCLGVLCELHRRQHNRTNKRKLEWNGNEYLSDSLLLPGRVRRWAGLEDPNPDCGGIELALHNDGDKNSKRKPKSFRQIAALIKKYL